MTDEQEYKMEQAVQLFNNNCDVSSITQIENVMLALKKFIEINKSIDDREDAILPRVYSFIALCNYKMENHDRAYWCAKRSIELGEEAMENSPFVCDTNLYLDQQVFALIDALEDNNSDKIDFERGYEEGEENIYDDSIVRGLLANIGYGQDQKPSENKIRVLIEALSKIQENASKFFEAQGDGFQAFQYNQMVDAFKMPLYCAWRLYKYGWHTDFMEEGDSLLPYMMFESQAKEMLNDLIKLLNTESPFRMMERDGAITSGLIEVYSQLLSDLQSGKVKL